MQAPPSNSYTSAISTVSRAKAANHVQIQQANEPIEGTFTIDPELRIPSWMLPPLQPGRGTTRPHLFLESKNNSVDAVIRLVHPHRPPEYGPDQEDERDLEFWLPPPPPPRALLEVTAKSGVSLAISPRTPDSYDHLRFHLKVVAPSGNTVLRLPSDFHGPIRYTTTGAQVRFSPQVRDMIIALTQDSRTGSFFIGKWSGLESEEDDPVWKRDEIEIAGGGGKIDFFLWGETNAQ